MCMSVSEGCFPQITRMARMKCRMQNAGTAEEQRATEKFRMQETRSARRDFRMQVHLKSDSHGLEICNAERTQKSAEAGALKCSSSDLI